jgi:hypothetical protein
MDGQRHRAVQGGGGDAVQGPPLAFAVYYLHARSSQLIAWSLRRFLIVNRYIEYQAKRNAYNRRFLLSPEGDAAE